MQAQIGHDLLELAVFFLQLAKAAQFGRTDTAVTLLPNVEGRLADAHLATDLLDTGTQLSFSEGKGDSLLGEFAFLHDMLLPTWGVHHAGFLCSRTVRNPGTGSAAAAQSRPCMPGLRPKKTLFQAKILASALVNLQESEVIHFEF